MTPPQLSKDGEIATIVMFPKSGPQDEETTKLLDRLRDDLLPRVEQTTGVQVYVGGQVASQEDFTSVIASKLPLFVGMVVLLSALLLMAVFRSVFIPIKAACMNLLSIGAALGFLTLVFQDGFLADALGVGTGPIESFVPVMTFAIVFGLSMDYEMFLVSRMREEWLRTGDPSLSVRNGVATTGRVITAAAVIMIVVFSSFALGPDRVIKEFGLGLAMAVLLDALIIRCLLVPALMQVVGRYGVVVAELAGPGAAAARDRARVMTRSLRARERRFGYGVDTPQPKETRMSDGTLDDAKGRAKEALGDLTGDEDLKNEGKIDRATGKVKDADRRRRRQGQGAAPQGLTSSAGRGARVSLFAGSRAPRRAWRRGGRARPRGARCAARASRSSRARRAGTRGCPRGRCGRARRR